MHVLLINNILLVLNQVYNCLRPANLVHSPSIFKYYNTVTIKNLVSTFCEIIVNGHDFPATR